MQNLVVRCGRGIFILFLLLPSFFVISCSGRADSKDVANTPNTIAPAQPADNLPPEDPTFVVVQDTLSTQGPRSISRGILKDKNGTLWFATWEGIVCYDGKQFTNVTLKAGLRHYHVFSILETAGGNLWFGTIGGGAYRYDGQHFTLFTTADGLAGNVVMSMVEDMAGNIWLGTDKGLSRYDGSNFTTYTTQDHLSGNTVYSMVKDKTGILWVGTNGGVSCFDGNTFTPFTDEKGAPFNSIRSIIEDKTGDIWIGSEDGLCRYDGKTQTHFKTNYTGNIFEDKTGNLWLSGSQLDGRAMSLSRFDGKTFTKIITRENDQIFGIAEDKTGKIWFGTVHGVYCYDGKTFTHF